MSAISSYKTRKLGQRYTGRGKVGKGEAKKVKSLPLTTGGYPLAPTEKSERERGHF